jgi:hypothetical protein
MRFQSPIAFTAILAISAVVVAQHGPSDAGKAPKNPGHAIAKAIHRTGPGARQDVQKTSSATGHVIKKTGHGVKQWAKSGPWTYLE